MLAQPARVRLQAFVGPQSRSREIDIFFGLSTSTAESMLSKTDWISPATLKKIQANSVLSVGVKHA